MKESYKRLISGIIYTLIFIVSLETYLSFTILTFIFGIICCYEFNKISQQYAGEVIVGESQKLGFQIGSPQSWIPPLNWIPPGELDYVRLG